MKRWALLVGLLLLVAACTRGAEDTITTSTPLIEPVDETPTTTIPTHTQLNDDDLHLVLLWNQHQPLYPNALGLERPAFVSTPIVPAPAVAPDRSSEDVATITIDAEVDTASGMTPVSTYSTVHRSPSIDGSTGRTDSRSASTMRQKCSETMQPASTSTWASPESREEEECVASP